MIFFKHTFEFSQTTAHILMIFSKYIRRFLKCVKIFFMIYCHRIILLGSSYVTCIFTMHYHMSLYNIIFTIYCLYAFFQKRGCFLEGPYQVRYLYFSWDCGCCAIFGQLFQKYFYLKPLFANFHISV